MKNFISKGITLNILVPAGGLLSGAAFVTGGKVVVCVTDGLEDETIAANAVGVYELPKEAPLVISQGDRLYLDEAAEEITKTAAGNIFAGYAFADELSAAVTVKVVLDGVSALAEVANVADEDTVDGSDLATTQALANSLKAKVNELLAALKAAGIMTAD